MGHARADGRKREQSELQHQLDNQRHVAHVAHEGRVWGGGGGDVCAEYFHRLDRNLDDFLTSRLSESHYS